MRERRSAARLHTERLRALCRKLDQAITAAAEARSVNAEALRALQYARQTSEQLCGEIIRLTSDNGPRRSRASKKR